MYQYDRNEPALNYDKVNDFDGDNIIILSNFKAKITGTTKAAGEQYFFKLCKQFLKNSRNTFNQL